MRNNATSTQHSSATTTTQAFTNHNCTNVGVQSKSTGVNATISGSNVTITFPQNTTTSPVTRTVTISGKTADNVTTSTTHTITQQAAVSTNMVFTYNGGNLTSAAGSIPATDFTLTLTNATLTSVSSTGGITVVTGGTATAPTIRVSSYPANQSESEKSYTITLVARDIYGRDITKTVTITQNADTYTFTVTPNPNQRGALDTSADFTVTHTNVSDVGISTKSSEITSATYNNGGLSVSFPMNESSSSRDMTVTLTGKTVAGRVVNVTATVAQYGGGDANLGISYNGGSTKVSANGLDTSDFTIASNNVNIIGYSANNGASIVESGQTNVTVRIPANNTDYEKEYTITVSGTSLYDGRTLTATTTVYQEKPSPYLEISYVAGTSPVWSSTSANAYVYYEHVDKATIGLNSTGNVNVSSFNKGTEVTTGTYESEVSFTPNTGASRPITVVISAYTVDHSQIVTATATVNQGAYTSGSGYIHVTPDGTSIGAAATSVTYTVRWIGLKAGTTLSFAKDASMSSISKTSVSITASNWSGETTVTAQVNSYPSTASGSSTRNVTLTASGKGFANENLSDTGYYKQSKSRSVLTLSPTTGEGAYNATQSADLTCTTAYIPGTGNRLHWVVTGGAFINSSHTLTEGDTGASSGAAATNTLRIYFNPNESNADKTYVLTGTATGEAGEQLTATFTYTHREQVSYVFELTPEGGENCYVARTATSHQYQISSTNINDETIGYVAAGSTNATGFDYATQVGTFNANTGSDRDVKIQISAKTLDDVTVYADATVRQLGNHAETDFISVTPDGTSIGAAATSVTFTISWNYAKIGSTITLSKNSYITSTPANISVTSVSGSVTRTVNVSANTGSSSRRPTLTANMTDVVNGTHSDTGYYEQASGSVTLTFGNLRYSATKTGSKSIDEIRFQSLVIGAGGASSSGAQKTLTNVSATTSVTSTWSPSSINVPSGAAITGKLYVYLTPTGTSITGNVGLNAFQTTFTGVQSSDSDPSSGYYIFDFNLGNVPSTSISTGNITVDVPVYLDEAYLRISGTSNCTYEHDYTTINSQSFQVTWANVNISSIAVSGSTGNVTSATITGTTTKYLNVSASVNNTFVPVNSMVVITGTSLNDGSTVKATLTIKQGAHPDVTEYKNVKFNTSIDAGSVTSISMAASETKSYYYAVEEKWVNGSFNSYYNDTYNGRYVLYTGSTASACNTQVASFAYDSGQMYSDSYLTISGNGTSTNSKLSFTSNNSSSSAKYYRITTTNDGYTAEMTITIARYVSPYSPNIWWTKTSGGASSTAVDSVSDVPAYVSGTYDGRNVTYTIYVNHNSDVSTISMDDSHLANGATASRNSKTVTITVPVNETTSSRSLGYLIITGTAPDGSSSDSARLDITQVAGVDVSPSAIFYFTKKSQQIASTETSASDTLNYFYVNPSSIGEVEHDGNITGVTIS